MWNIAYHGWIIYNIKLKTMKFCLMYGKNINVSYNYDTNFSHAIKKKKILPGFCIHGHWRLTGQKGKEGIIFYSTLLHPPAPWHSDIHLQLCMWDDYHILLIAQLVLPDCYSMKFTTLWNYHLIDWWWDVDFYLFVDDLILSFWYSNLIRETSGLEPHQPSPLASKQTDWPSVLVIPMLDSVSILSIRNTHIRVFPDFFSFGHFLASSSYV